MLNLFIRKKLFDLNASLNGDQTTIRHAIFSCPQSNSGNYRLLLCCDENQLLLCQLSNTKFDDIEKLWIPTDPRKGSIVAFCFNSTGSECLVLTEQTFIYRIPLTFKGEYDAENEIERKIVQEDAQVIHSCSLSKPTCILWWDRTKFSNVHSSIAIVGNKLGQISILDLDTQTEIRQLTVPFPVESLKIFEEIYSRSLLINCAQGFQYTVTLELLRSALKRAPSNNSKPTTTTLECGLYFSAFNAQAHHSHAEKDGKTIFDSSVKPQPLSIKEEEKKLSESDNSKFEEFIEIFDNDLHISLWPENSGRTLYLVKQCKPAYEFENDVNSFKSENSGEFCSIATKKERNIDIYEFNSQEFSSERVFLNGATKYFFVGLNGRTFTDCDVSDARFKKIINCGERFLMLVFTKFVAIVSKHFAEQKSISSHSPRSPLLLKKTDSFRNSGSFRRKNFSAHSTVTKANSVPLSSIVETFTPNDSCPIFDSDDEIVDVFFFAQQQEKSTSNCAACESAEKLVAANEVERIFNMELSIIEHKLHSEINELFSIGEQFLIVTKNGTCHHINCQEMNFGDYFHNRICELLQMVDEDPTTTSCLDGDLITNAKYIVDCFVSRTNLTSTSSTSTKQRFYCHLNQTNISPQNRLTTWQFWITRSALLLMKNLSDRQEEESVNREELKKILRLFELSRTPRRRVITSLIYFHFWTQALQFLRKYFETQTLQELNGEERLFLSHQMLDCLLHNLLEDRSNKPAIEALLKFLRDYFSYYDIEIVFQTLLDKNLFSLAKFVARVNYSHVQLIEILLKNLREGKNRIDEQELFDYFTRRDIGYHLLLATCYPTQTVLDEHIFSLQNFEEYLDFILQNLSELNIDQLAQIERVFDPTKLHMQMLMEYTINSASDGLALQSSNKAIERRDILNLYIFILLVTFKRRFFNTNVPKSQEFSFYDWNFLSNIRENFSSFKQQRRISISTPESRTFVSCGAYFSALAINDQCANRVFLWGRFPYSHPCDGNLEGSNSGQRSPRTPLMLKFFTYLLPPGALHSIAAGAHHILFLTDFGIFVLGSSTYGQLGLGDSYRRTRLPAPIQKFYIANSSHIRITKIACGSYHSLAITDDGQLFVWGWALHGQLGNGSIEDVFTPQKVNFADQNGAKVVDVAAGYAHTIVLFDNGDLFAFGDNSYNQLGVDLDGKSWKTTVPMRMCGITFGRIRVICCGLYHTVVLAVDESLAQQKLYSWGLDPKTWRLKMRSERKTDPSVRGSSNLEDFASPIEINLDCFEDNDFGDCRIIKIVAGQAHNVLLTQDGRVLSFGFGREGQLGLGPDTPNCRVAARIVPELFQVTDIAAGVVHSLAVTNDSLWGWGQNAEMAPFTTASDENSEHQFGQQSSPQQQQQQSQHSQQSPRGRTQQEDFWSLKLASLQKSNESIPHRIVRFERLLQSTINVKGAQWLKQTSGARFFYPDTKKVSLVDKLKMCLVRYTEVLDQKQMVARFKTFHLTQLSSVLCIAAGDYINAFKYQLEILCDELKRVSSLNTEDCYGRFFDEFRDLSIFFLETILRNCSNESEMTAVQLKTLMDIWNEIGDKFHDQKNHSLKKLLTQLYLDEDAPITSPYFGLNLMKIVEENEDELRRRFVFDDQFLLDLLTKTAHLTQQDRDKIVQFQVFMEQFIDRTADVNGTSTTAATNFPLELEWRKNMAMLLKEDAN